MTWVAVPLMFPSWKSQVCVTCYSYTQSFGVLHATLDPTLPLQTDCSGAWTMLVVLTVLTMSVKLSHVLFAWCFINAILSR